MEARLRQIRDDKEYLIYSLLSIHSYLECEARFAFLGYPRVFTG